jgi:type VI secretion system secreted protein VgrG
MAVLELSFESKEDSLLVRSFTVREALSAPYEVTIVARSRREEIDFDTIVGKPAGFLMMDDVLPAPRAWSGVCNHMEQLQAESTGLSTYYLRIVPALWLTTLRRRNRIFEHLTIPAIVEKVLGEYSIKPKLQLVEPHGEHEYRVQFEESDFAFISRLLEEEGITYLFEQTEESAGYGTQVVLTDQPEAAAARGRPIRFIGNPTDVARQEFVTRVRIAHRVRPGNATHRDFDFVRPDFELVARSAMAKAPEDFYEQYRYAPSALIKERKGKPRTPTEQEAKLVADIALEADRRRKREVSFDSNVFDLGAGKVFSIGDHPRAKDLGPDKRLLISECTIDGALDSEWSFSAVAAFASERFRPLRQTPKPVVEGVESAIVVGPDGQEIDTDEYGRVRVQFHWDRDGQYNEQSSCWVRVSQGWSGAAWGMLALPRIGQEVIVDFLEGDPDQPILVGRAFNKTAPVPFKLPAQQATSTWKTKSSPKSEGFNEIMFDDAAGKELFFVQAQRNLSKLVKVIETERTGNDRTQIVGANRTSIIGTVDSTVVGARYALATITPKELGILKLAEPDFSPRTTLVEMVDEKITLTTGKVTSLLDGDCITIIADRDVIVKSGGEVIIEGKHVHLNGQGVSGAPPAVDVAAADGSKRPQGRVLGAVKDVFGAPKPVATRLAMKTLILGYRSPIAKERVDAARAGTSPEQMMARRKVALDFYKTQGLTYDAGLKKMRPFNLPAEMRKIYSELTGIDFKEPLLAGPPPPVPEKLTQWHVPERKGQYYAPAGTSPSALGLGMEGIDPRNGAVVTKTNDTYSMPAATPYLASIASDKTDTWSLKNKNQKSTGGGKQFYYGDTSGITNLTGSP